MADVLNGMAIERKEKSLEVKYLKAFL